MSHVEHTSSSGRKLPSVSSIPGIYAQDISGFEDWLCKQLHAPEERCCVGARRKYYQDSADLGNDIHALREAFLQGKEFSDGVPEYQAKLFEPVARFYRESGYKPLTIEKDVYKVQAVELKMTGSEFGGTLDGAGTFSAPFWEKQRKTVYANYPGYAPETTDVFVEDLKIKSKLSVLHPLQLYGYARLLKELYGIEANWGLILRREKKIDKRPEIQFKIYFLPDYEKAWECSMYMYNFLYGS